MKHYVFIMAYNGKNLLPGTTSDIEKTVRFLNGIPSITHINKGLVYLEETIGAAAAEVRLNEISAMTQSEKESLITDNNPQWVELIPGVNIEL